MNPTANKIKQFNAGRDRERLALKMQKMRSDPFVFLRGSCHLFYQQLPDDTLFTSAPHAWICGDLHLENFGSYKGDNRLVYFDINDFDESLLAPSSWDLLRFLVSVQLGVPGLGVNRDDTDSLCRNFITSYANSLASGKARWIERETAEGLVHDLLDGLRERSRAAFLDSRTELKGRHRRIRIDGKKALTVTTDERVRMEAFLQRFAGSQPDPGFFRLLDVAKRIAGTGSLGLERYIILIEGKGSPDGNYLLDLKQAVPSSLKPCLKIRQPDWQSEAERIVTLQERMQAIPMAFLQAVHLDGQPYVLRSLQPSEDRVALEHWKGKLQRLEQVIGVMGQLTAWAHLRSSGRCGSAIADELIEFGQRTDWHRPLLAAATRMAASVRIDWQEFANAFDRGFFG